MGVSLCALPACGDDAPANDASDAAETTATESTMNPGTQDASDDDSTVDGSTTSVGDDMGGSSETGDVPPASGARVLYGHYSSDRGTTLHFTTYENGVAGVPVPIGDAVDGGIFGFELSPSDDFVRVEFMEGRGYERERLVPVVDGVPTGLLEVPVAPGTEIHARSFAPDGSGLMVSVDGTSHHVPLLDESVGEPVELVGSTNPTDVSYYDGDRVVLVGDADAEPGRELYVVAVDDPLTPHLLDPDASYLVEVTTDGTIVYASADGLFAMQLDGLEVAVSARIDDEALGGIAQPVVAPTGTLVSFFAGDPEALYVTTLAGVIAGPSMLAAEDAESIESRVEWSPNGEWLHYGDADGGRSLLHVAGGEPGTPLPLPEGHSISFAPDSSVLILAKPTVTRVVDPTDLLAVDLADDTPDPPFVLADLATYVDIDRVFWSRTGELAFSSIGRAGVSLWYFADVQSGAVPVELTAGPVDGDEIHAAQFTPDGASVVVNRGNDLVAIDLATPGVETELASGGAGSLIVLP